MNNNVTGTKFQETNTVNVNDNVGDKYSKDIKAEAIAMKLVQRFGNHDWFPYYCKVAYKIPEHIIWNLAEQAVKGKKNPGGLFKWLCDREMYRHNADKQSNSSTSYSTIDKH